jgi:CheY-like chemotaxis protein
MIAPLRKIEVKRLLLVIDDLANRLMFGVLLEAEGFRVVEAGSLVEARALIGAGPYRCVLLDHELEDGVGLELLPLIRKEQPQCRVILLPNRKVDEDTKRLVDGALDGGQDFSVLTDWLHSL